MSHPGSQGVREARWRAHSTGRPGCIDDSCGRPGGADGSSGTGTLRPKFRSPRMKRQPVAKDRLPGKRRRQYQASRKHTGKSPQPVTKYGSSRKRTRLSRRREKGTFCGKKEAEEEEDPWREFGMAEAGHADGDSAQAHDGVSEALLGIIDTLIQEHPQERMRWGRSATPQQCSCAGR